MPTDFSLFVDLWPTHGSALAAVVIVVVEKSWNRPIALHLHAQPNNFVRFIRPISHCFSATAIDEHKKRKYHHVVCVNILLCIGQAVGGRHPDGVEI